MNTNAKEYSYGEVIRQQRIELGMTQRQVADQCGITDSALAHIEREMRLPSELVAGRIAKALALSEHDRKKFTEDLKEARKHQAQERVRNRATVKPILGGEVPGLDPMVRMLADNDDLRTGCHYLQLALKKQNPQMVLQILKIWAEEQD